MIRESNLLEYLEILSFEIGNGCNLAEKHDRSPINQRKYVNNKNKLSSRKILECIKEAQLIGFNGYVAFHYYNEPLLYKEKIEKIIVKTRNQKFVLFTNGTLLNEKVENNSILNLFDIKVITCYDKKSMDFLNKIKSYYSNVIINSADLDDRLNIYKSDYNNILGCKRPLLELPIDYYGNIHLCCYDWDNQHYIGNINEKSLREIIESPHYETVLNVTKQRLLNLEKVPEICKRCNHILLTKQKLSDFRSYI